MTETHFGHNSNEKPKKIVLLIIFKKKTSLIVYIKVMGNKKRNSHTNEKWGDKWNRIVIAASKLYVQ